MKIESIREVLDLVKSYGLSRLEYRDHEIEIAIERSLSQSAPLLCDREEAPTPSKEKVLDQRKQEKPIPENLHRVESPLVGVFYEAPAPGEAPFVKVGDRVKACDVVCIVEAMKMINEIQAGKDGVVERIAVENEESVEYGQLLLEIRSDV